MGTDIKVVQAILGHSAASVTWDTYQHVNEVLHRDAAERMNTWLLGGG